MTPERGQVWHDKEYPDLCIYITDIKEGQIEWYDDDVDAGWMTFEELAHECYFDGRWWSHEMQKESEQAKET